MAGSDPNAANAQLPYDPIIEDRSRAAAAAAAVNQGVSSSQMTSERTNGEGSVEADDTVPKAFACGTCNKGFARRSDLVRHGQFTSNSLR